MLNAIRRAFGLHVHDWEETASEAHSGHKAAQFVQSSWRPWDLAPATSAFEIKTLRCRGCDRTRTTRVQVG